MKNQINRISKINGTCCVTIVMNTHRTRPDLERDPIQLKNLIKEAEAQILEKFDKRLGAEVITKLWSMHESIDYTHNLSSLVVLANENFSEFMTLDVPVTDQVSIGNTFLVIDMLRALQEQYSYLILVLGKDEARLIQAKNNTAVKEFGDPFPIVNEANLSETAADKANALRSSVLVSEFFNHVDKRLREILNQNPLPVFVCTEASNFPEYMKVTGNTELIAGHAGMSMLPEKDYRITEVVWETAKETMKARNLKALTLIEDARSKKVFLSGINEIHQAVTEGRGRLLFITNKYDRDSKEELNTLVSNHVSLGGEVLFVPEGMSTEINGDIGLITRY